MEPTGMSWFPVAHRLADAGAEVARVKGKRVKALRRYLSEHAKTDLADAQVLAAMPGFEDAGADTAQAVLEECARFSQGVWRGRTVVQPVPARGRKCRCRVGRPFSPDRRIDLR